MILFLGLASGAITTFLFERLLMSNKTLRRNFWDNHKSIFGYHFHHSLYGGFALIVGVLIFSNHNIRSLFLMGFGVGIILVHTITDGRFVFIEKTV